ncbi:MAG: CdaR family protein [Myxococcota bacterium]
MKGWFTENTSLKLIALLLALILYLFVRGDRESVLALYIQVDLNVPAERVLLTEPVEQIKVTVRGKRSALNILEKKREGFRSISIDLSDVETNYYEFSPDMLLLPPGVTVTAIQPPGFSVELDRQGLKALDVVPRTVRQPAEGYRVTSWNLTPSKVEVSGPMSVLEELSAVVTEPIDLTGRTRTFETGARVRSISSRRVSIEPKQVKVQVVIEPTEVQQTFKGIPIQVHNTQRPHQIEPATIDVTLKGPPKAIAALDVGKLFAVLDAKQVAEQPPATYRRPISDVTPLPEEVRFTAISPPLISLTILPPAEVLDPPEGPDPDDPVPHPDDAP